MKSITIARELFSVGRFRQALEAAPSLETHREPVAGRLLRAELLVAVGEAAASLSVIEAVETSRGVSDPERAQIEFVRSLIDKERGNFDSELHHLQKSISFAERAHDTERLCLAQLSLVALVADRSGPETVSALLGAARSNVIKLGNPSFLAALHIVAGELDGKRSLLASASRHIELAQKLLQTTSHLWFDAWSQTSSVAISILQCEFEQALNRGETALATNLECGVPRGIRSSLGNLGHVHLMRGEFDLALEYFNQIVEQGQIANEQVLSALENIAQIHLARGAFEQSLKFLEQPEWNSSGVGRYAHRYGLLTRAQVLFRLRRWNEGLSCTEHIAELARQVHDDALLANACLLASESLVHLGRVDDSWAAIASVAPTLARHLPDTSAQYERATACVLAGSGRIAAARGHKERAQRIFQGLGNTPAVIELSRSWEDAKKLGLTKAVQNEGRDGASNARDLVQNVATLMLHAGRPNLLATGLVAILKDADCATGAVATARDENGVSEELAAFGTIEPDAQTRTLSLGKTRNRTVEVRVAPLPDIESQATVNAVTILLGTIHDLERAQAEREERLTLWPIDELPYEDDDSVIAGRMRELMAFARKVARTNVTVLITGESGTGKEVLARAIHGFSGRAKKPFVPFNCTAIPRELLESQLFGYRRGAFTGAERDNPGLIRAAKDGTLFFDEVGELGLDLQPKLLRFLESGEINPLGETSPFNVDVRIVAATNANLERLVEEGRFREDLFYRLNVICLSIPPLRERRDEIAGLVHHFVAKAANEFGKGRVRVAEETMERLLLFSWPGNVRQLQNELRRMVALADVDSTLTPSTLSKTIRQETMRAVSHGHGPELAVSLTEKLTPTLLRIEREMIKTALRANQGHAEATAKALGISRKGLYLKRQRLGV
jgi:transcriptional regulator with PAS, ATPase and Fis domain/tetratricopeptide (TPR) repeat protein